MSEKVEEHTTIISQIPLTVGQKNSLEKSYNF